VLEQFFPTGDTYTTGSTQSVVWWYAKFVWRLSFFHKWMLRCNWIIIIISKVCELKEMSLQSVYIQSFRHSIHISATQGHNYYYLYHYSYTTKYSNDCTNTFNIYTVLTS
jgi:hypothetical protein